MAIVTLFPELYSFIKNRKYWIPINTDPYAINDDYHYYSLLNHYHRKILRLFDKSIQSNMAITTNTLFQSAGYILNLVPYHIGYLIKDHRFAIILVRLCNRFFLAISVVYFTYILLTSFNYEVNVLILFVVLISYLVHFPGLLSNNYNQGVFSNIKDNKYLYKFSHVNDLTRAMFCETSAPLFILSVTILMIVYSNPTEISILLGAFLMQLFLFFLHIPTGVVNSYLMTLVLLTVSIYWAIIAVFVCLILTALYVYKMSKDEVGNELFIHNDNGKIFNINFSNLRLIIIFTIQLLLIVGISYYHSSSLLIVIMLSSGIFYYFKLFVKHQMDRFWGRSAVIVFQLVVIIIFVAIINDYLFNKNEILLSIMGLIYLCIFIYFYSVNSYTLYKNKAFYVNVDTREAASEIFNKKIDKLIITDSQTLGNYIYLYSLNNTLMRNYSLQDRSYKYNLELIIRNFKLLGYPKETVIKLLSKNVNYAEMLQRRPFNKSFEIRNSSVYNIQFMATYYIFNHRLKLEEFYDDELGWSNKYINLLRDIWDKIHIENPSNYRIYNFKYFQ